VSTGGPWGPALGGLGPGGELCGNRDNKDVLAGLVEMLSSWVAGGLGDGDSMTALCPACY
jgi:hypothetical protein